MAVAPFTNGYVSIDTYNLSSYVTGVSLPIEKAIPESVAMGATTKTRYVGGVEDWTFEVEFNQDFADAAADDKIYGCRNRSVAMIVKFDAGATTASNPRYYGNCILQSYAPISGQFGEVHKTKATFLGNGALTRADADA